MRPHRYLILVDGDLRATDREGLSELAIRITADNRIALRGDLDHSALLGVLARLRDLALEVLELHRTCGCGTPMGSCAGTREARPITAGWVDEAADMLLEGLATSGRTQVVDPKMPGM
jgi:hypothetical protein